MQAGALGVVGVAAARDQIGFVAGQRFGDSDRAAVVGIIAWLAAGELSGGVESLPIGEHRAAVARFQIIGERDALDPFGTVAVGDANGPGASPGVAAVAHGDAGREPGVVRFLAHREATAGGGGFELGGARLGHSSGGSGVRWMSATAE